MNTLHSINKLFALGSLLALSIGFVSTANAGPGIDYFRRMDSMKNIQTAPSSSLASAAQGICADAKTISITEARRDWANGKGPVHFVQVGTKSVCHSCGTAAVAKENGTYARGARQATEVPAEHACGSCGTESSS